MDGYVNANFAIATASSTFNSDYPASGVIDGLYGDPATNVGYNGQEWASSTLPAWVRIQLLAAIAVVRYDITARANSGQQASNPYTWTFEGSNDGSSWTTLDTQTAQTFTVGQTRSFTFANTTAYSYYRLNVSVANGATLVVISELRLSTTTTPSVATAGEVWVVVKSNTTGLGFLGASPGGVYPQVYPYSDGKIYEEFGRTSRAAGFTPTLTVSSWRIYRVSNNGTTWQAWIDGVSQASEASIPVGWITNWILGATRRGTSGDTGFSGNIAEVLVRSQLSTSQEVSDITAYLTAQHFVTPPAPPARARRAAIVASLAASGASRW